VIIYLTPSKWFQKASPQIQQPLLQGALAAGETSLHESKPAKAVEKNMKILTFFESISSWLKAHFKNLPSEEVQISSAVNYIVPFVEELDDLVDPTLAPIINPIIDKIKTGLAALATTITAAKTPAGTANTQSVLASLVSNATALESAFQVKDAATQTKVTSIVNLISGEFNAIQSQLASTVTATS
jgi:hypothetical protein